MSLAGEAAGDPAFAPGILLGTGINPHFVAIDDVNGDAVKDIVIANRNSNTVAVFLGRQGDIPVRKGEFPTGAAPMCVAIKDVNGDEMPDVITANEESNTVSVLLGTGGGTFELNVDYPTGDGPHYVVVGDVNHDEKADLIVTNVRSNSVSVFLGRGDGTFGARMDFPTGEGPFDLCAADLNADGNYDLATANYYGTVSVLLGNGDGTFRAKADYGSEIVSWSLAAGDVNSDGKIDLAVGNWQINTVSIRLGRGDGTFGDRVDYATGSLPDAVAIEDLDGDGQPDIAVTNYDSHTVSVLPGNGDGTFRMRSDYQTGNGPESVAIGDVNGDRLPDLVVANQGSNNASIYSNIGPPRDRPPALVGPIAITGLEGNGINFIVSVSDPDGDPIASLTAMQIPSGAAFSVEPGTTKGEFAWIPSFDQAGVYTVTFTASNALSSSSATQITVLNTDRPPVLDPIPNQAVYEGASVDVLVHALDPDGGPVSLDYSGPGFSTLGTVDESSGDVHGAIHVAPSFSDAGLYPGNHLRATSLGMSAEASFDITITNTNRSPIVSGPLTINAYEGSAVAFQISAVDPDGDPVTLAVLNMPVGAVFIDNGGGTGAFTWTPAFNQAGSYSVSFVARDIQASLGIPKVVAILVLDLNRAPAANAGGPYTGIVNVPLRFNGTGSSDPDGSPLAYAWAFGDGITGTGPTPSHTYTAGGTFTVTLSVSDGSLSNVSSSTATIQDVFPARAFTSKGNATIRLKSAKSTWCVQIEPVDGSYFTTDVLDYTVVMKYASGQVQAQTNKNGISSDLDGNGVQEVTVCFSKADLRSLFASLPNGTNTVTVTLEGELLSGGRFTSSLTINVVSSSGGLAASVWPNPINPVATLGFTLSQPGPVTISVYTAGGRLVRRLISAVPTEIGHHELLIDGQTERGIPLPSGVYFYRIEAPGAKSTGRFVVAR